MLTMLAEEYTALRDQWIRYVSPNLLRLSRSLRSQRWRRLHRCLRRHQPLDLCPRRAHCRAHPARQGGDLVPQQQLLRPIRTEPETDTHRHRREQAGQVPRAGGVDGGG